MIKYEIADVVHNNKTQYIDVETFSDFYAAYIRPKGYGDYDSVDGQGAPILIEFRDGIPYVIIFDDINNPNPSHIISLEKASEKLRKEIT